VSGHWSLYWTTNYATRGAAAPPWPLPSFDAISETNIEDLALDVCFGSQADMSSAQAHVRFTPNSDRESGHYFRLTRPALAQWKIRGNDHVTQPNP
jgi:hypothetical protein